MKRTSWTWLSIAALALFGFSARAQTTSWETFEAMGTEDQEIVVRAALATIFNGFSERGDADTLACLVADFHEIPEGYETPLGYLDLAYAMDSIRNAEMQPSEVPSIERIVFNVVQDRCVTDAPAN